MGLHRGRRFTEPDVESQPPVRFHRDPERGLAAGRQGTDHRHARPPARGGSAAASRLPHPAAPGDRLRAPRRADPVPQLAERARREQPRRRRLRPVRGLPGSSALPARRARRRRRGTQPRHPPGRGPERRGSGQSPGTVHHGPGQARSASLGWRHTVSDRRNVFRARPEQNPTGR